MKERIAAQVPVLIYDGLCGFCRIWIDYSRQLTGDKIEYLASQNVGDRFPQIPPDAYGQSVQLVRTDGTVASGARAVFETLGLLGLYRWIAAPSEIAYRWIAAHRDFAYQFTRFTFGTRVEKARFEAVQWIFHAAAGDRLRGGGRVAGAASGWIDWRGRHIAGQGVVHRHRAARRRHPVSGDSFDLLVFQRRSYVAGDGMVGRAIGGDAHRYRLQAPTLRAVHPRDSFRDLSFLQRDRAGFFVISMGFAASGSRFSGDFLWGAIRLRRGCSAGWYSGCTFFPAQ